MAIQRVGSNNVDVTNKAHTAGSAAQTRAGIAATKSTISGGTSCCSNVFAAVRKCLSCIPVIGRLFVVKPAPVVVAPVAPKPALATRVATAAFGALVQAKNFVVGHKALTAGVASVGAAVHYREEITAAAQKAIDAVKGYFAPAA